MRLKKDAKFVFIGDDTLAGSHFISHIKKQVPNREIINKSMAGDTMMSLLARIESDALDEKPEVLVIMIGSNDIWENRHDVMLGTLGSMLNFEDMYRSMLRKVEALDPQRVILIEPFYVSYPSLYDNLRYDASDKMFVVRKLAREFGYNFVGADGVLNSAAINTHPRSIVKPRGLQVRSKGQILIAEEVIKLFREWSIV
ncbi:hypothetical protein G7062_02975 [Erysipelothrix sp. HDW6C]|uniref:SGNH/GDSL hydrolase family protein n=1 Tax=Erysipelothrix sp. HDW6C TaxID=2714930 RepID=UPI00140A103C|nr:GDSL-type esterase/lipase family protein [Erysipelothrix sp. HDW6C]QIK69318.1 hypothetical protein G7062_02975 [Erysipelothrix sp. HDW6C]